MKLKLIHPASGSYYYKRMSRIANSCSRRLMQTTVQNLKVSQRDISVLLRRFSDQLRNTCTAANYQRTKQLITEMNSRLYSDIKFIKDRKFSSLCSEFASVRAFTTHDHIPGRQEDCCHNPEDLPLTQAKKSVLSKGFTFVPVNNKVDEYQVKADCKKYYRRLRLKADFHRQANNKKDNEPNDGSEPFEKFDAKISKWTPPDGQFSAVDHYIDQCVGLCTHLISKDHSHAGIPVICRTPR